MLATMDQAVARIHRMNQLKETYIHTVVIKDTIEESLMDNILDKKVSNSEKSICIRMQMFIFYKRMLSSIKLLKLK